MDGAVALCADAVQHDNEASVHFVVAVHDLPDLCEVQAHVRQGARHVPHRVSAGRIRAMRAGVPPATHGIRGHMGVLRVPRGGGHSAAAVLASQDARGRKHHVALHLLSGHVPLPVHPQLDLALLYRAPPQPVAGVASEIAAAARVPFDFVVAVANCDVPLKMTAFFSTVVACVSGICATRFAALTEYKWNILHADYINWQFWLRFCELSRSSRAGVGRPDTDAAVRDVHHPATVLISGATSRPVSCYRTA
eukprot:IDg18704t1